MQDFIDFKCNISGTLWTITNIYGPAHEERRQDFIDWLSNIDSSAMKFWMILGDFNLIRDPQDRSRPGGNSNNMLAFNSAILAHDLEDIPIKGRAYTWSNMKSQPLLEKLDWIFTSPDWTLEFPNTMAFPLAHIGSDHIPIHIQVGSHILKSQIFRCENYWYDFDGFMDVMTSAWNNAPYKSDAALSLNSTFKCLRPALKKWSRNISQLNNTICKCNYTLAMIDGIENQRSLTTMENNFRTILKVHTAKLWKLREYTGRTELKSDG
jgi:hypothetical protein